MPSGERIYLDAKGREISILKCGPHGWCAWVRLLSYKNSYKRWRANALPVRRDRDRAQRELDEYCAKHNIPWVTAVVATGPGFADRIEAAIRKAIGN